MIKSLTKKWWFWPVTTMVVGWVIISSIVTFAFRQLMQVVDNKAVCEAKGGVFQYHTDECKVIERQSK